jgi:hypothetical protein
MCGRKCADHGYRFGRVVIEIAAMADRFFYLRPLE